MDANGGLALADALLTTIAVACAVSARIAIAAKRVERHRNLMIAAVAASAVFMVLFVVRFVRHGSTPFEGAGVLKVAYYAVFFSHEPLAVINVPLVVCTLVLGLRGAYRAHKEVARIAFPIWVYVAVTGVMLYLLLYVNRPG
jgi:putative membrane protein